MSKDFKATLNLPLTGFPLRAKSVQREPERLAHWESLNLYERIQEKNRGHTSFILHDGPPYANGDIHLGHALNKILKDIILRYRSMSGFRTPYVPGWDCHGLPIEQQVLKKTGPKVLEMSPAEVRRLCHDYAAHYVEVQREQFKRLGILGDWDNPYITFDPKFEAGILQCLRDLTANGLVRRGFKVVHWDPLFRTALAEAEIEYHSRTSEAIYVRFPLLQTERYPFLADLPKVSLVIWTTTPWTLPANAGVCLHPSLSYVAIEFQGNTSIVAEGLAKEFTKACGIESSTIKARFSSSDLAYGLCRHPIHREKTSQIILGNHVTLEQGTGCVHIAPGHGVDDFQVAQKYKLPVSVPVDEKGCFTEEYPEMQGINVFKANPTIIKRLEDTGLLLAAGKVSHDYPFSWRSKQPVIFRATEQWFMELGEGKVREKALEVIDSSVQWYPRWGYERIRSMVENRPDWCLSRQRSWGVPIPAIRSKKTGESILNVAVIDAFIERVRQVGSDAWFNEPLEQFLPEDFVHEPTGESTADDFVKEFDILDVWFDSGSSHIASLEQDDRLSAPADLYLEGSDQHRGWFQSALLTSIGTRGCAPYKAVLTHGFVLDGEGKAMSKSVGNSISPLDLVKSTGGDILRLWVASVDYRNDVRASREILSHVVETYRKIRNTLRYQIGNLTGFDFDRDSVSVVNLLPIDAWALHQTALLINQTKRAYENYEFQKVYQLINRFCTVTLSSIYHDILKDRLYTFAANSKERRSAQTVIYHSFHTLSRLLAPILVFTTDESYSFARANCSYLEDSIHLQSLPLARNDWLNPGLLAEIDQLLGVRDQVNDELEKLRREKIIGQSLEARIDLVGSEKSELFQMLSQYRSILPELFIVSEVSLHKTPSASENLRITAQKCLGLRCPRCWRWVQIEAALDGSPCPRTPCPMTNNNTPI